MSSKKLFVLALDGVPFSLLNELLAQGHMPHLQQLRQTSSFSAINSVQPPVSSSAWASFATGCQPPDHGILGFVDRDPAYGNWFLPNAANLQKTTLWQTLSEAGKRVFVMNVPVTYPAPQVNGIAISGFLSPDIRQGTYPRQLGTLLQAKGYRIDADTELAKTDLEAFYRDLTDVFNRRVETMWDYYQRESWDFFMVHIMETDRLHHFFWNQFRLHQQPYKRQVLDFYHKIDLELGRILGDVGDDTAILLLSDHGFTSLRYAAYLNRWLADKGYLGFTARNPADRKDIHPGSRAFSLYPGRIYLRVQGRADGGPVAPGAAFEELRNELIFGLQQIKDPQGQPVMEQVLRGEEIYTASDPHSAARIPDLVCLPNNGYDLKGNLWHPTLFDRTVFTGMHTYDDAFVMARHLKLPGGPLSIDQLYQPILDYFG